MMEDPRYNELLQLLTNNEEYAFIHIDDIKKPFDGAFCMTNRYWLIVADHILVYCGKNKNSYSPQCNKSESIAKHLLQSKGEMFAGWSSRVQLIEYAFVNERT